MRSKALGFTLLELMIVVVVIAILAALAFPSYMEYIHKGRRSDALRSLGELQLALERWRAENPCYGTSGGSCPTFTASGTYPTAPVSDYYTIAMSGQTATAYTITATPKGSQTGDRCGTYTFSFSAGTMTKTAGSTNNCSL